MKRSQLGLLAESFANGEINRPAYEHERRELIEGITSGRVQINRCEPGETSEAAASGSAEATHSTVRVALAAGAVVALLVLVWLAVPAT